MYGSNLLAIGGPSGETLTKKRNNRILYTLVIAILSTGCCADHSNRADRFAAEIYAKSNIKEPKPPHIFKSDGCSCFPDGHLVECCVMHDLKYWMGGTSAERLLADSELQECVSGKGYPKTAKLMYYGVRVGGVWWLPTHFRWGFGWDYPQSGPPDVPY